MQLDTFLKIVDKNRAIALRNEVLEKLLKQLKGATPISYYSSNTELLDNLEISLEEKGVYAVRVDSSIYLHPNPYILHDYLITSNLVKHRSKLC